MGRIPDYNLQDLHWNLLTFIESNAETVAWSHLVSTTCMSLSIQDHDTFERDFTFEKFHTKISVKSV